METVQPAKKLIYNPSEVGGTFGPHHRHELDLMLAGMKPMAMVPLDSFRPFKPYVKAGTFVADKTEIAHPGQFDALVALPDEAWRFHKIKEVYARVRAASGRMTAQDHTDIGRLLGYSDRQIHAFVQRMRKLASDVQRANGN